VIGVAGGDTFHTLFTCGAGWGVYGQSGTAQPTLEVLGGNLDGFSVRTEDRTWLIKEGRLTGS